MNKAFQIFKRDILRLIRNPVAVVITIGVCIIPSLYAWYNIVANWDPYASTANIKIAVANNDQGTSNEYVTDLNAGDQIIEQLRENDDLGWTFVDAAEAKDGVERGDYYAAIIIPKDFSRDLTSMLTGTFTEPKLTYYVNEKKNAIAPKVTDTGAETIEEQINDTFVATATETVVDIAKDAGIELKAQGEKADSGLVGAVRDADASVQKIRDMLDGLTETIDTTAGTISSADDTLQGLSDQLPSLTTALSQSDELLGDTRATARIFATSLNEALTESMTLLGSASVKANAAVGELTGVVSAAQAKVDLMLDYVQMMIDANQDAIDELERLDETGSIQGAITELVYKLNEMNEELQAVKDGLQDQSDAIKNDADALSSSMESINGAVQAGSDTVGAAQGTFSSTVMPQLSSGLDAFSSVTGDLSGIVGGLAPTITSARGTLSQLSATLEQTKATMSQTSTSLGKIQESLKRTETDVAALRSSDTVARLSELLGIDSADAADFMASPVTLTTETIYPVATYGSGVAPFYTNLALWVGGVVLIAIFKLEVDREGVGHFSAKQGYFGRWLLMVSLGFVQALIVCVGDLVLGMQCEQPVLFVIAGIVASFVYVNIIYSLAIAFKHIGKALAVVFVIIQIPGSSGMYPIEMMPGFYRALHPLLPFTYSINAMRECVGGMYGSTYFVNVAALFVFFALSLVVGVWLRPLLLNLNLLFDRQLATTGVMICETNDLPRERYSLRTAMRALLDAGAFREQLLVRAARFEHRYPYLIKFGFCLVFGLPVVLFILTSMLDLDISGKIVMLVLWIVAVIGADLYMIIVEYIRESLNTQMRISAMSDEGLREEISKHTAAAPLASKVLGLSRADDDAYRSAKGAATPAGTAPLGAHAADGTNQVTAPLGAHAKPRPQAPEGGEDHA